MVHHLYIDAKIENAILYIVKYVYVKARNNVYLKMKTELAKWNNNMQRNSLNSQVSKGMKVCKLGKGTVKNIEINLATLAPFKTWVHT